MLELRNGKLSFITFLSFQDVSGYRVPGVVYLYVVGGVGLVLPLQGGLEPAHLVGLPVYQYHLQLHIKVKAVFWIRIIFYADPDPNRNADPDLDPGSKAEKNVLCFTF